jgi:hypothetical protein
MGGLIRTKGTIRIARFLTEAFSGAANMAYWHANATLFDTGDPGWVDLWNVINAQPSLQLPAHPMHPNLPARWQWFMNNTHTAGALSQANHNAIANAIHLGVTALTGGAPTYRGIIFDAIEGGTQTVLPPQAITIPTVAGAWWLVVLQTPAMPAGSPAGGVGPLDGEFDTFLHPY